MQLILERPKLLLQTDGEYEIFGVAWPDIKRDKQVIPNPKELEDAKGSQSRHRQRHNDAYKNLQVVRAVDTCAFQQLARQGDDVVTQQIDRQRQTKGGVRDPQACE